MTNEKRPKRRETRSVRGNFDIDSVMKIIQENREIQAENTALSMSEAEADGVEISQKAMQQSVNLTRSIADKMGYDPDDLTAQQAEEVGSEVYEIIHYGEDEPEHQAAARKLMAKWNPEGEYQPNPDARGTKKKRDDQ